MLTVDPLWDLVGERTGCRIKQEVFNRLIMEVGGACGQNSQSTGLAKGGLTQCVLRTWSAIACTYRG